MMSSTEMSVRFETLLDILGRHRGFEFTACEHTTLERRVQGRLGAFGLRDYGAYLERLAREPQEFTQLFNALLSNVVGA